MTAFVVELLPAADLERHIDPWAALVERALEPNVFLSPSFHLPALRHLAPTDGTVAHLLVWREGDGSRELVGFLPVAFFRRTKGAPLAGVGTWRHAHLFLGTPLLDRYHAEDSLRAILMWVAERPQGARLLRLARVNGDGDFAHLLARLLAERGWTAFVDRHYLRPVYRRGAWDSVDEYLRATVSPDWRRRLGRLRRRLADQGEVSVATTSDTAAITQAADRFLHLEAGGWKGRGQTALASCDEEAAFFREMLRDAGQVGRLLVTTVDLDGAPIAMRCTLLAGEGGYAFKTAYDEGYARYSPGSLVEVEHLAALLQHHEVAWVDSCATGPGSPVHRLWSDRRAVHTLLIPLGDPVAAAWVRFLPHLKAAARWWRRVAPGGGQANGRRRRSSPTSVNRDAD